MATSSTPELQAYNDRILRLSQSEVSRKIAEQDLEARLKLEARERQLRRELGLDMPGTANSNAAGVTNGNSNASQTDVPSIGIGGIGSIEDITKQAKDLAQFRLGLDFQGMDKSAALRESESQNNFGRTQKLTDQTFNWQRLINQDTEGARTQRNTDQLNTQKELQSNEIGQENFAARRAIGLASRRLGS